MVGTLCFRTKLGSACPHTLKPIYWHHVVCGKGEYNVYCRALSNKNEQRVLKRPEFSMAFRGGVLKAVWGRGCRVCDQLVHHSRIGWHQGEISSVINLLVSNGLGSMCLWSAVLIWCGLASCKNNIGMCARPLCISFRGLGARWFCDVADL